LHSAHIFSFRITKGEKSWGINQMATSTDMNFCGIPLCQIRAIQADFIHMLYDLRFEENFKKKLYFHVGVEHILLARGTMPLRYECYAPGERRLGRCFSGPHILIALPPSPKSPILHWHRPCAICSCQSVQPYVVSGQRRGHPPRPIAEPPLVTRLLIIIVHIG